MRVIGAIERDQLIASTHHHNFPECDTVVADIGGLAARDFRQRMGLSRGELDGVVGSPPCQLFSTIGSAKIRSIGEAADDQRRSLPLVFAQYVIELAPQWFVMENVPGIRGKAGSGIIDEVRALLSAAGYRVDMRVLSAEQFGVPQTRKRLFLCGFRGRAFPWPEPSHEKSGANAETGLFDTPALPLPVTLHEAIGDLPGIRDGSRADRLAYPKGRRVSDYARSLRSASGTVGNNICRMSNERAKSVFVHMRPGDKYMDLPPDIRKILPFREDIFADRLKRLDSRRPAWTVIAHIGMDGYMYIHPTCNRTLSVREAARIQSFHDDHRFLGNMREQYVQVGNAVPPRLAAAIARAIMRS
jgi:DNA (cytosine-5)-methyltransferase 1